MSERIGVVQSRYGLVRRMFFPFYARDQLITLCVIALPFLVLATTDLRLALYTGIGAYLGMVVTQHRSTPSSLILPGNCEARVIAFLDQSEFLKRTGNGLEWMSTRGRMMRWDTDKIRLMRKDSDIQITGRLIDLQIISHLAD